MPATIWSTYFCADAKHRDRCSTRPKTVVSAPRLHSIRMTSRSSVNQSWKHLVLSQQFTIDGPVRHTRRIVQTLGVKFKAVVFCRIEKTHIDEIVQPPHSQPAGERFDHADGPDERLVAKLLVGTQLDFFDPEMPVLLQVRDVGDQEIDGAGNFSTSRVVSAFAEPVPDGSGEADSASAPVDAAVPSDWDGVVPSESAGFCSAENAAKDKRKSGINCQIISLIMETASMEASGVGVAWHTYFPL